VFRIGDFGFRAKAVGQFRDFPKRVDAAADGIEALRGLFGVPDQQHGLDRVMDVDPVAPLVRVVDVHLAASGDGIHKPRRILRGQAVGTVGPPDPCGTDAPAVDAVVVGIPAQQVLPGQLGLPIDGGGILGRVFRHGFDRGRAVQGDGAHEEKPLHPTGHRRIKQHLRGTEIDLKRQRRILFAHARHKRAEMEDPLDAVGRHRPVQIEIRSAVALHVGDRIHNVLQ